MKRNGDRRVHSPKKAEVSGSNLHLVHERLVSCALRACASLERRLVALGHEMVDNLLQVGLRGRERIDGVITGTAVAL